MEKLEVADQQAQDTLLLRLSFCIWRDDIMELRQEEEFQRMAIERRNLTSKSEKSALRMLVMLMASQEDLMVTTIFNVWRDSVTNTRLNGKVSREVEALQFKLKAQGVEHTQRFLRMLVGSQGQVLKK